MKRFNPWLAEKITSGVATMWCAYLFAGIALISLPKALQSGDSIVIVSWIAQTFLQLVLLSIIMVGQKVQSASVEQKIDETHTASLAEFELAKESRRNNALELAELKEISKEIQTLIAEVEKKLPR
ncbi:MAG: hypothetical protein NTW43_04305 [Actinobacteria bacterium]|nr:hypothetical protein [Actinomycetota bacterium]